MNGVDRLRSVAARMTFQPGWRIEVNRPINEPWMAVVQVMANVPQVDDPSYPINVAATTYYDGMTLEKLPDAMLVEMLSHCVQSVWMHEFDEWLKLDGEHVRDPHPELRSA